MKAWDKYSFAKKDHFVNQLLTGFVIGHSSLSLPCYKPSEGLLLLPIFILHLHVHPDHHHQVLGSRGDPLSLHLQPDLAPVQRHVRLGRDGWYRLNIFLCIFVGDLFYHLILSR